MTDESLRSHASNRKLTDCVADRSKHRCSRPCGLVSHVTADEVDAATDAGLTRRREELCGQRDESQRLGAHLILKKICVGGIKDAKESHQMDDFEQCGKLKRLESWLGEAAAKGGRICFCNNP